MKENSLKVLVIVLTILVVGLGGFIVYGKVLNNKNTNNDNNNNIQEEPKDDTEKDNLEEKLREKADTKNLTITKYLEEYLLYVPFSYDADGKLKNKSIEDIYNNNEEISYSIWNYVWLNAGTQNGDRKLSVEQVDNFVYEYFNLKNYKVKNMVIGKPKPSNIFGLTKKDNFYIATVEPIEWHFPSYEVFEVKYLENVVEVSFKVPFNEYPTETKTYTDEGILYLKYNNGNFNFIKTEFKK